MIDEDGDAVCPECGRKAKYVSIEDDEQYGFSTVKYFCKNCDVYIVIQELTDGLSDGAVEEALGGHPLEKIPCPVCNDKGFIKQVCPECEGNPDEIGDTGCSTCEGDNYIMVQCEKCK